MNQEKKGKEKRTSEAAMLLDHFAARIDQDFFKKGQAGAGCIAGVSGGPDSMAMLDLLVKAGWKPVVCHVNYHKRPSAKRDEDLVQAYCKAHHLPFRKLDAQKSQGNFQAWAREIRMDFFEKTAREQGMEDIFLAHQMDDCIETYLMQKKRDILCDFFGLQKLMVKKNLRYQRPLLRLSKKELENYCEVAGVHYGIDESNLSDVYLRNSIRHSTVEMMDEQERKNIILAIEEENNLLAQKREKADALWQQDPMEIFRLEGDWQHFVLERWLYHLTGEHLSRGYVEQIARALSRDGVQKVRGWRLERFGDHLYVGLEKQEEIRPFEIRNWQELEAFLERPFGAGMETYKLSRQGTRIQSVSVTDDDFPLRFEPYHKTDKIQMRFGTKKISRIYIDRKLPHFRRETRFLIKNRKNEVIFVPQTGCDIRHFSPNPSFYMVEF